MPLNAPAGDNYKKDARQRLSEFQHAETALKAIYALLTGGQKSNALTALTNWNFSAANPTVGRENALYVAVCLLFVMVGYLIRLQIKE